MKNSPYNIDGRGPAVHSENVAGAVKSAAPIDPCFVVQRKYAYTRPYR